MSNSTGYEVPTQVRDMAEKSVDQAKKAFEAFMDQAQKAVSTMETQASAMQAGGKDFGTKAVNFAETNMAAAFEFAHKVVRASDVSEIVRLQNEFIQTQMRLFGEQAKELGVTASRTMADAAKPRA